LALIPHAASACAKAAVRPTAARSEWIVRLIRAQGGDPDATLPVAREAHAATGAGHQDDNINLINLSLMKFC